MKRIRNLAAKTVFEGSEKGQTQIDMILERKGMVVDLCEMKFVSSYSVDAAYHEALMRRLSIIRKKAPKNYDVEIVLITTFGLKRGGYADDFQNVIDLDDLFKPD